MDTPVCPECEEPMFLSSEIYLYSDVGGHTQKISNHFCLKHGRSASEHKRIIVGDFAYNPECPECLRVMGPLHGRVLPESENEAITFYCKHCGKMTVRQGGGDRAMKGWTIRYSKDADQ